jgi:hypothetical protein
MSDVGHENGDHGNDCPDDIDESGNIRARDACGSQEGKKSPEELDAEAGDFGRPVPCRWRS